MSDDILDRLTDLIQQNYGGDSMETLRDPIATLLKAQDEIKELRHKLDSYDKWFCDHAALLATHRIGGYRFGEAWPTCRVIVHERGLESG